jgi:putative PIN family toxin of toxin-antitoxin system
MRAVLDTNVLVRATTASIGGPAWDVLDRISRGGHTLVLSAPLLFELADVLQRPRLQAAIGLTSEQALRFVAALQSAADIADLSGTPVVDVPHDPKDVDVVLTAVVGRADVICTRDRHLRHPEVLAICQAHGIRVLSDIELLDELRRAKSGEPSA